MAGTSTARICVFLAIFVVLLSTLTEMANTMDLPYSDEAENLPYDVMDRPVGSPEVWQRRVVDTLLDALILLRDEMDTPTGDNVKQVVKKAKSHYLFWRSPVLNGRPRNEESSSRKRSN